MKESHGGDDLHEEWLSMGQLPGVGTIGNDYKGHARRHESVVSGKQDGSFVDGYGWI